MKEIPDYVVIRHGDGALCVSIRGLDRNKILGGLFALSEFFARDMSVDRVHETTDFKTGERIVIHPPGRA